VDGLKEHHEEIRGIKKGFEKCFETIRRLRSIGVRRVVVAHTLQESNLSSSYSLYRLARREGLDFGCVVTENSEVHFLKTDHETTPSERLTETLERITRAELLTWNPKRWMRGLFSQGLHRRAMGGGRSVPCTAGHLFFFLSPWGEIYPCNVLALPLGNIKEKTFEEIWQGGEACEVREKVAGCEKCFMSCSVYPEVRRHPLRYLVSAAGLKLKAHFGLPILDEPAVEREPYPLVAVEDTAVETTDTGAGEAEETGTGEVRRTPGFPVVRDLADDEAVAREGESRR
jgi:MoaA/NifB/PqqE/SkfB family radical SAM enzyme